MIHLVIGLNVAIALCALLLARRLWRLKRTLTSATVAFDTLEQEVQMALSPDNAAAQLLQGRDALWLARMRYRRLRQQLQQLQQIFSTAVMILRLARSVRR